MSIVLWVGSTSLALSGADAVLGVWQTQPEDHGYAHIEIQRDGDRYFGQIVWLSEPDFPEDDADGMGGEPKTDRQNPDPALRDRPLVGLRIIDSFEYVGNDQWKKGRIYDPSRGKTYRCQMKLTEKGELKVRGFIGVSLLGRNTTWRRPSTEERTTETDAAIATPDSAR